MQPINYVDALNEHYGALGFPPYRWTVNETAPLHRLERPVRDCRVSILVSGGVSLCSVAGFDPEARNDHRLDQIPADSSADAFQIHDAYYDHTDADEDINCILPLERLRELEARGEIGSIAPRLWSGFMGRIYNRTKVMNETAPAFVEQLHNDGVDLLIAVPA